MKHYRERKTKEQLREMFKDRDLETELKWAAEHTQGGYFRINEADYIRWLCYAALDAIKGE